MLDPDKPIRLPSKRRLWQLGAVGFAVYVAVAAHIRYADPGAPMPPEPMLSGCFESASDAEGKAEACFDWSDAGEVPSLTLRVSESDSPRTFVMAFDHRRPRSLIIGANPDRRVLALRSLLHQNSFGRTVTEANYGPRDCRLFSRGASKTTGQGYWRSDGDCAEDNDGLRVSLARDGDEASARITLDGRTYRYEDLVRSAD